MPRGHRAESVDGKPDRSGTDGARGVYTWRGSNGWRGDGPTRVVEGHRRLPEARRQNGPALGATRGIAGSPTAARQARLGVRVSTRNRCVADCPLPLGDVRKRSHTSADVGGRCSAHVEPCRRLVAPSSQASSDVGDRGNRGRCCPRPRGLAGLPPDGGGPACGAAGYQVDRGVAVRQSLRRRLAGVLRGGADGGVDDATGATEHAPGRVAHVRDESAGSKSAGDDHRA
jgi:hypothetical protein